jgi:mannose-6-phosphate isomerase-like protein (cupin superfamily)
MFFISWEIMERYRILNLETFVDHRGALTVLENMLPFPVARAYWIHGADGIIRGGHRHHRTRQALVALNGEVSVYMEDELGGDTVTLNKPNICLLVEPKDWHQMTFSKGAILLVFASHSYDQHDYIEAGYGHK